MTQILMELVESFCAYQRKQRGKTEGGVTTYRWNLDQYLRFVRDRKGSLARVSDVSAETIQALMDEMASADLSLRRCARASPRCRASAAGS